MERQQIERCMAQVAAYRASGMKAKAWAEANGVPLSTLSCWGAHYARWQARLEGASGTGVTASTASAPVRPIGFVAARVAVPGDAPSVRIELDAGACRLNLHWPLAQTAALATLLKEFAR